MCDLHASDAPLWDGSVSISDYAKSVNLPPTMTLDLAGGVKMELELIPAGKFIMGAQESEKPIVGQTMVAYSSGVIILLFLIVAIIAGKKRQWPQFSLAFVMAMTASAAFGVWGAVKWNKALKPDDVEYDNPAHLVTLTQSFYMGKYVVTQEQYKAITNTTPSKFKGKDNPVEQVSWIKAQEFCKKLTAITKRTVRLPTEAEWEYSCRAGSGTMYYSGNTLKDLDRVAWYADNSNDKVHPVGLKQPNAFGLYDMIGNVWQWCDDWKNDHYYGMSVPENPHGPPTGVFRVIRGGSFLGSYKVCRSASRLGSTPDGIAKDYGFRVVVEPALNNPH